MFVLILPVGKTTTQILFSEDNSGGDLTINYLELATYIDYIRIFVPLMATLYHIENQVGITAADS